MKTFPPKFFSPEELAPHLDRARDAGRTVVFTNGCFDVLHIGHVRLLVQAKAEGDLLVVALNTDASVRRQNKGEDRPIHRLVERGELLAALAAVDFVTYFDEDTPLRLIERVQPDVLVKGGDWGPDQIVGSDIVEARGGRVVRVPLVAGKSTTKIVNKMRES
jgi:D-glycero-beta-D-manno-heptose 1-phosphate adenylyltransferase